MNQKQSFADVRQNRALKDFGKFSGKHFYRGHIFINTYFIEQLRATALQLRTGPRSSVETDFFDKERCFRGCQSFTSFANKKFYFARNF